MIPDWVEDRLADVAESYCPDGYENNDGGYGSLTVYPAEGIGELEHYDHYEDAKDMPVGEAELPRKLRRQLKKLGVAEITAHFDGSNDSGQIEEFEVLPMPVEIDRVLQDQIEDLLVNLLPDGWEVNEGSYGTFTIDVDSGTITIEAASRLIAESEANITRWKWRD